MGVCNTNSVSRPPSSSSTIRCFVRILFAFRPWCKRLYTTMAIAIAIAMAWRIVIFLQLPTFYASLIVCSRNGKQECMDVRAHIQEFKQIKQPEIERQQKK